MSTTNQDLLAALHAVEQDLNANLIERQDVVRVLLCALIAQHHAILLGDPGTGKSTAINRLAARIAGGGAVFKKLLSKDTDTGEIFGPVSLPGLMAEEQRRALKYGAAPGTRLWFLDEIWKSSSALLNALLTALEEREYDNDGKRTALDLLSCFAASNEPPQNDGLRALRDRFALCMYVEYVSDRGFIELSRMKNQRRGDVVAASITLEQLSDLHALRRQVVISDNIVQTMTDLRRELRMNAVVVSDRRMLAAYDILAAHALLCGRMEVKEADLSILRFVLWSHEHERESVAKAIAELNSRDRQAQTLLTHAQNAVQDALNAIARNSNDDENFDIVMPVIAKLKSYVRELVNLASDASGDGQPTAKIMEAKAAVDQFIREMQNRL